SGIFTDAVHIAIPDTACGGSGMTAASYSRKTGVHFCGRPAHPGSVQSAAQHASSWVSKP
ncbi:MAG: hypothetical protein ACLP1W_09755, partial [Rhodomicrobium sp.]